MQQQRNASARIANGFARTLVATGVAVVALAARADDTVLACPLNKLADPTGGGCAAAGVVPHWMFATSQVFTGNLGGLAGADTKCNQLAAAAGLPGSNGYRAWLSATAVDARGRFPSDTRPVLTVARDRIANSLDALAAGNLLRAPNVDERGVSLANDAQPYAWTATLVGGTYSGQNCATAGVTADWTDTSPRAMAGLLDAVGIGFTATSVQPCGSSLHLYCISP